VPRIGQVLAGRGHQVLGPAQALGLDEVEVESEPIDDEVVREVASRGGHALDVRDHRAGDVQAARIVVAAVEQDAGLALVFALEEASHRAGSAVEACPTADIDQRDRVALADVREEGLQVDLLDPHLDVIFAIVPKAHRIVLVMNVMADVLDPASGELFRGLVVEFLDMLGGARLVVGADVDRQIAGLAASDEQPLDGREIGLGRAMLLEDVTPSAGAHLEIEACSNFLDEPTELLDLCLVSILSRGRLATATPLGNKDLRLARVGSIV